MVSRATEFEGSIRRMLGMDQYHDQAKLVLRLIHTVAERGAMRNADPQAELKTKCFLLVLELRRNHHLELISPCLSLMANASRDSKFIREMALELKPVVDRILFADQGQSSGSWRPSATPPNACS